MVNENYRQLAHSLVKRAKEKGLVAKYSEFCKSDLAKKTAISKEDMDYYISQKGDTK